MPSERYLVLENFHVFVPQGEGGTEKKVIYLKGQVVEDVPEGQSAEDWIEKGLTRRDAA